MINIKIFLLLLSMCAALSAGIPFSAHAGKQQTQQAFIMTSSIENIEKLQLGSIRIDIKEYPKSQLKDLIYELDRVKPADKEAAVIKRGGDYFPISLIYMDGTKDVFFFFEYDGNWYVETDKGSLYKNADFITDFTNIADIQKPPQAGEGVYELTTPPSHLKMRLELEADFGTLGIDFQFAYYTKISMENNKRPENEAKQFARNQLTDDMKLYQCAKQLDITVSDEDMDKITEKYISDVSQANYFKRNYKKIYEEAGTSLSESAEKNKEIMRFERMSVGLYEYIRREFADGKDRIGDHVYDNTEDYYNAYLEEIVYPQIEESVMNDFEKQLDHAEKIYSENYGNKG